MRGIKLTLILVVILLITSCGRGVQTPEVSIKDSNKEAVSPASEPVDTETDIYEKRIGVSIASLANTTTADLLEDEVYLFISEKFNIDIEHYPMTFDNWNEKNRMWISAGDMPDEIMWNFEYTSSFSEYIDYVEQGLIAPLPEGWETKYPNLEKSVSATQVKDYITVDGKTYMLPHPVFLNFAPVKVPYSHETAMYRKDWADKLGMEIDRTMSLDQMVEYVNGCKEKDFDNIGGERITGFTTNCEMTVETFVGMYNNGFDRFYKKNGEYVWGPAQPETLDGIMNLKKYYDLGVIDPDFYLDDTRDHWNKFASGTASIMFGEASIGNYIGRISEFAAQNQDKDAYETIGLTVLLGPDDKYHGDSWANYWAGNLFKPDIDEEVFDRLLSMHNWLGSVEGQEVSALGVESIHWNRNSDGSYEVTRPKDSFGNYLTMSTVCPFAGYLGSSTVCGDDFNFVDPSFRKSAVDEVIEAYKIKESFDEYVIHFDPEYIFFKSDAKDHYSADPESEIIRLIITKDINIAEEWEKYVKSQEPIYQPVLDDLNNQ